MAKKIRESDIFQGDIFANAKKSADAYLGSLNALQGELKEMLTINKAMLDQSTKQLKTTSDLQKRTNAIQQVTKADKGLVEVEKEKIRVEQELEKLSQQREKTAQQRQRTQVQNRKEEERLAKIKAKNLKLAKQEGQAYSQMSKKLTQLRNKYKNLAVQNKENTKEGKKLLKTIQQMDTRLKQIDKSVGQSQRNVGNYTSAWGKLGAKLKSVASAFGLVGGVMGAVQLIKNGTNVVIDFDSAIANLGAVSGASEPELEKLKNSALDLGESTKFTASEVAGLQLELAKLGFTTPEILDSTESILNLASATGTDLANASQIAGSTLRAFNLDASEMDRVASVLGVSTTKSALNMEFLQTAMSKVAPVSSAMGFSIEDTTALLGGLANAGFDASTSATSTRNILLKLADSGGDLAQALGRPVKNLPDLVEGLKELDSAGVDLATSLELTDKRSVAAFQTFLKNTDTLVKLKDGITDVNDELAEMSQKQLNTISGQMALLNSKWQGMILGTSESAGAVEGLKNAIKFLTNNLGTIFRILGEVLKLWAIYKGRLIALRILNSQFGKSIMSLGKNLSTANFSMKGAVSNLKKLGGALKGIGFAVAIDLALKFAHALYEIANGSRSARIEEEMRANQVEKATNEASETIEGYTKKVEENIKAIEQSREKALAKAKTDKEIANQNAIYDQQRLDAIDEQRQGIQKLVDDEKSIFSQRKKGVSILNSLRKKVEQGDTILIENSKTYAKLIRTALELAGIEDKRFTNIKNDVELIDQVTRLSFKMTGGIQAQMNANLDEQKTKVDLLTSGLEEFNTMQFDQIHANEVADLTAKKYFLTEKDGNKNLINLLNELKKKRTEIERQRTNELLTNGQTLYFNKLTQTSDELLKQIGYYEDILKGTEKIAIRGIKTEEKREEQANKFAETMQSIIPQMQDDAKKEDEILKQRLNAFQQFTNQIIQQIDKRSDAEIRAIDKELAESEKREDELRQLAIKGTTTAQQSLASEQKRQAELERQREEIEKKKLRRQAILSGLDLLSNKIDNDEPDAVASSIRDIASLIAIIGNLPAFAEGTEYIERGNAPKGTDKILARVDEGERIMTKQQNRQLTGISNDELTKIAQDYKSGSFNDVQYIKPKQKELHTPFQSTSMILDKFDSLQKTIENKPMLTEVKWDDISQMIVEKVETKNRIENRHKSSKGIF